MTDHTSAAIIERVHNLTGLAVAPPRAPIPWAARLMGFARGDYRISGSDDSCALAVSERAMGVQSAGAHGFHVRLEDIGLTTRSLIAATSSAGGYLVDTENVGYAAALQAGTNQAAQQAVDLVSVLPLPQGSGNTTVPTGTAALTTGYQTTESSAPSDSTPSFGQTLATPHTAVCTVTWSRLLDRQSAPAVNGVIETEFRNAVRTTLSTAILGGAGTAGAPLGILNLTSIGTSSGATCALSNIVTAQQTVAAANGIVDPSRLAFVAPPATAGTLMQRFTSPMVTPLWSGDIATGNVIGVRSFSTTAMPASTLLFGDFSTVLLVIWGGLEIQVDPYQGVSGSNFTKALITARVMITYDVIVRHPVSFYSLTSVS